jgi:aminopeptidase N
MRSALNKHFFLFSLLALVLFFFQEASSSAPNFDYDIQSHHLNIQIDPYKHFLKAEDRLKIELPEEKSKPLSFLLHPKLGIIRIKNLKTGETLRWSEASFSRGSKRVDISLKKVDRHLSLSISYEGVIYDPVQKEKALQFVRGDQTSGLISPEGVYLSSSSHWFPDRPDSMAAFEVEASIPDPLRVVTQGELLSEARKGDLWKSKWTYSLPAESLTLVAGRYSVKTRNVNGVKISTYFFGGDEKFSDIFLKAAEEYLKIYSDLLGPYPFKKFDIVQNFFSSGYSFPTFTLLAPEAIRQGKEFLRPGALDHEIVHSWWGHAVGNKPGTGNWVEALTSYCTNYFYKELKMGEQVARKHRQDLLQKYAVQVPPAEDYPLRKFEGKGDEVDGQIGYGKGSMVFHMLRQIVGKNLFFATLREFSRQYRGKEAAWADIQRAFEEASGKRLDRFFSQWLDRPGGPKVKLENVATRITPNGYLISGEVVQEGDAYDLSLPAEVDLGTGKKDLFLEVAQGRTPFSVEVPKLPLKLTLDPDAQVFRRLYPEEIVPCLNVLLEDPEKVFIISSNDKGAGRKIYIELARMTKANKGGEILSPDELTEEKVLNSSLMFLGESWRDPRFSKLLSNLPGPIRLKEGQFYVNGRRVDGEAASLLITFPHPVRPGKWVTIYFGSSAAALSRARYIFFYGWDSYLLFRNGRPAERGSLAPGTSFTSYDFVSESHFGEVDTRRLREHVTYLTSPELAGRLPGTLGYQKAQAYLLQQLEEMGIQPILQPFSIKVKDVRNARVTLQTSAGLKHLKAVPFIFSEEGEWRGPCLHDDGQGLIPPEEFQGKIILMSHCIECQEGDTEQILLSHIIDSQLRGAAGVVFFMERNDLDKVSPYVTYPSYFPPELEERLRKREKEGYFVRPSIEASKVVAKERAPDFPVEIPVVAVPYSKKEEESVKHLLEQKELSAEISVLFDETRIDDFNIGGLISSSHPGRKSEFVVMGAHYDHLGRNEKDGSYYPGADDNASGVSALLEIGGLLSKRRQELRRSLLILFFGGEEWGLRGSREFVQNPFIPLKQIKAMLSLDSIGGSTEKKEVYFVGGSVYPALSARSKKFLEPLGIEEEQDIDSFAFSFGSDHFPFYQKGIPVLDYFASDYKKVHTHRDTLEAIDFEKLSDITRLIYLTAYELLTEAD